MPSYTIQAETVAFILNAASTAVQGGWFPVGTIDLRHDGRKGIATDICKGSGYCSSIPVELACSLACTPIGWPMQGGYLMIELLQEPSACPTAGEIPSVYGAQLYVSFGCPSKDPITDGVWQGESYYDGVALNSGGISYGLTLKTCARMVVNLDGSLSVNVEISRIAPADDIHPPPPSGENQVIPCGTISTTLGWFYPTAEINTTRIYTKPGGTTPNQLIDFNVTNPDKCPLDVKSVRLTLVMNPYKVGCNGAAEGYLETDCSLDAGTKTYSCFSALIKPSEPGRFFPVWLQLGVNGDPEAGNHGCFNGSNSGTGLIPPTPAYINPAPLSGYPPADDLMNCGCPGENKVTRDSQQIQYGTTAGTFGTGVGDPVYEIVVKSVNKGAPCVAMRLAGVGNPWTVGAVSLNNSILNETGHWVATATFPTLLGSPVAIIYGLQFPNGIIANCVSGSPGNVVGAPQPQEIIENKLPEQSQAIPQEILNKVQETKAKMKKVKDNPCIHLGMALETTPSCGCSGGILHKCSVHGSCRISGNTKEMNCWRCPDYIDHKL